MNELISMIPLFILCVFIYFMSSYFLKKDNQKNKDSRDNFSNMNFNKYINLKTKYVKFFSICIFIFLLLKVTYIILAEYVF